MGTCPEKMRWMQLFNLMLCELPYVVDNFLSSMMPSALGTHPFHTHMPYVSNHGPPPTATCWCLLLCSTQVVGVREVIPRGIAREKKNPKKDVGQGCVPHPLSSIRVQHALQHLQLLELLPPPQLFLHVAQLGTRGWGGVGITTPDLGGALLTSLQPGPVHL